MFAEYHESLAARSGMSNCYAMIDFFRRHPYLAWSITFAILGAALGYFAVGNFGVASRGRGFGVWGWLLCAALGAYVGFRFGEWRKRKTDR